MVHRNCRSVPTQRWQPGPGSIADGSACHGRSLRARGFPWAGWARALEMRVGRVARQTPPSGLRSFERKKGRLRFASSGRPAIPPSGIHRQATATPLPFRRDP